MAKDRKRAILPAPLAGSLSPDTHSSSATGKAASSRTSTACQACKRRKSRCAGRPTPCQMCRTCGTECIVDATLDQRRKISVDRLVEQCEVQRELLKALFSCLRDGNQNDIQKLSHCILKGPSTETVADHIHEYGVTNQSDSIITAVDQTLGAYAALLREQGSSDGSSSLRSRKDLVTSIVSQATSVDSNLSPEPQTDSSEWVAADNPDESLGRTHRRRLQYVQSIQPTLQTQTTMDSTSMWSHQKFDQKQALGSDTGLMEEHVIMQSPGLAEQTLSFSSFGDRSLWHPVLRIVSSSEVGSPMIAGFSESGYQINVEVGQDGRRDTEPGQSERKENETSNHVEVIRSFPSVFSPHPSSESQQYQVGLQVLRFALHSVQPLNRHESSPFSRVIIDYRLAARRFIAAGNSPMHVFGSGGIAVDLLFRERQPRDGSSVCNWASEIWRSFDDWDIFVRLANVVLYTLLMQWTLVPTAEQYSRMPDSLKPTPLQCLKSHHAAVDFIPFPAVRDGLVRNFRDWLTVFAAANISVGWTGPVESALMKDTQTGQIKVTDTFSRHITDLNNWSIGNSALEMFPELAETGIPLVDG